MAVNMARAFKSRACNSLALRSLGVILRCRLMIVLLLMVGNEKLAVVIGRDNYLSLTDILATTFHGLNILRLAELISQSILINSIIIFSSNLVRIFHFDVLRILMSKMVLLLVLYALYKLR